LSIYETKEISKDLICINGFAVSHSLLKISVYSFTVIDTDTDTFTSTDTDTAIDTRASCDAVVLLSKISKRNAKRRKIMQILKYMYVWILYV